MQEVFFVAGQAASGKSEFSRILAANHDLKEFDLDDTIQETIAENRELLDEVGMEKFLAQMSLQRYDDLLARALRSFYRGNSVLLQAPFTRHIADIDLWKKTIAPFVEEGVTPILYWVNVPPEVRRQRLASRSNQRDEEKIADLDAYFANNPTIAPVVPHISVDGTSDFSKDNF